MANSTPSLNQGDVRLLESDDAQRFLVSTIPARFAYIAEDGTARVLATWFHWTGEVLAMPTFLAAPHVRHAAGRLRALRANPHVAITIDTVATRPGLLGQAPYRGEGRSHEAPLVTHDAAALIADLVRRLELWVLPEEPTILLVRGEAGEAKQRESLVTGALSRKVVAVMRSAMLIDELDPATRELLERTYLCWVDRVVDDTGHEISRRVST